MSFSEPLEPTRTSNVLSSQADLSTSVVSRERVYSALILFGIAIFTVVDIIEDRADGAPISHILLEGFIVLAATVLGTVLFRRSRAPLIHKAVVLEGRLVTAQADATKWKAEASQLLEGLSTAIARQMDEWKLSDAEKDVALLILKGFSHKEISSLRQTSERTVRHQAAAVYEKSGLTGRAELSAFFLEDLLAGRSVSTKSDDPNSQGSE